MPRAIQTIAGFFTGAGAGTGVATPSTGDTFAVASTSSTPAGRLSQVYGAGASTDWVRVRSPRMHDNNQGLRLWLGGTKDTELLPWGMSEVLFASDTPTVEIDLTAAATGGILLEYDYDDVPGINQRLGGVADIQGRIVHIAGVEVDVTSGIIGNWGAGAAINTSFDNFKADTDYALLGYLCSVAVLGLAITGQDTGNVKVGGPGNTDTRRTCDYFVRQSELTGRSCIPIIAANNKGGTLLQAVDVAAATATKVTLLLAELG